VKRPIRYFFSQTNLRGGCALFTFLALDLGCAKIAGIDDNVPVNPNGTNGSALCINYCDAVMTNCPDPLYVYASRDMCMGVCHQLEVAGKVGNTGDQSGNTINCRLYQAQQAGSTGEKTTYCPVSGPGGNNICGSNCEDYCTLMQLTCPDQFKNSDLTIGFNGSLSICLTQCALLPVLDGGFNADLQSGNNIDCRLYHVSAANADPTAPQTHCPHAAGASPCTGAPP
jgi:hypothetical protein